MDWVTQERSSSTREKYWVLGILVFIVAIASANNFDEWAYTHWLFNYDFGLIKRALIGEILSLTPLPRSYVSVNLIALALAVILSLLYLQIFRNPIKADCSSSGAWLFCFFWVTYPSTIAHALHDVGRLDTIGMLASIIGMLVILKYNRYVSLLAVLLIGSFQSLVHEANFMMFVPGLCMFWIYRNRQSPSVVPWILFLLVAAFLLALESYIGSKSSIPGMNADQYFEYLKTLSPQADDNAVLVLFRTVDDNLDYSYLDIISGKSLARMIPFLIGLAPSFYLIFQLLKALYAPLKPRLIDILVFGATLSPLLLQLIAVDHYRWWSAALSNLGIMLVLVAIERKRLAELSACAFRFRGLIFLCIVLNLFLGPLPVYQGFHVFNQFREVMGTTFGPVL
ncbi:hypothetical protein [Pseudomonas sp. LRF_L74]|uniref:hypothetical protein n=1 Tax=Pseudomonas sp. LRF_L74 TaxID=3369422 RepID=UPI003F5F303A